MIQNFYFYSYTIIIGDVMTKELFTIGERIQKLRENAGMSQAALAKKFKISRSAVNYWEMGLTVPSTEKIVELAKLFNVSTDNILGMETTSTISINGLTQPQVSAVCEVVKCFRESNYLNESSE